MKKISILVCANFATPNYIVISPCTASNIYNTKESYIKTYLNSHLIPNIFNMITIFYNRDLLPTTPIELLTCGLQLLLITPFDNYLGDLCGDKYSDIVRIALRLVITIACTILKQMEIKICLSIIMFQLLYQAVLYYHTKYYNKDNLRNIFLDTFIAAPVRMEYYFALLDLCTIISIKYWINCKGGNLSYVFFTWIMSLYPNIIHYFAYSGVDIEKKTPYVLDFLISCISVALIFYTQNVLMLSLILALSTCLFTIITPLPQELCIWSWFIILYLALVYFTKSQSMACLIVLAVVIASFICAIFFSHLNQGKGKEKNENVYVKTLTHLLGVCILLTFLFLLGYIRDAFIIHYIQNEFIRDAIMVLLAFGLLFSLVILTKPAEVGPKKEESAWNKFLKFLNKIFCLGFACLLGIIGIFCFGGIFEGVEYVQNILMIKYVQNELLRLIIMLTLTVIIPLVCFMFFQSYKSKPAQGEKNQYSDLFVGLFFTYIVLMLLFLLDILGFLVLCFIIILLFMSIYAYGKYVNGKVPGDLIELEKAGATPSV